MNISKWRFTLRGAYFTVFAPLLFDVLDSRFSYCVLIACQFHAANFHAKLQRKFYFKIARALFDKYNRENTSLRFRQDTLENDNLLRSTSLFPTSVINELYHCAFLLHLGQQSVLLIKTDIVYDTNV